MGATVTTFCNATNIVLYTALTVVFPYYSTYNLQPGKCVSYTVGRIWFTAFAVFDTDTYSGNLYFPISEVEAAGLLHGLPFVASELNYVNMTPEEAKQVMTSSNDVMNSDIRSVSYAVLGSQVNLQVQTMVVSTNKNKKIVITGGPKAVIYKQHPAFLDKHMEIVPAHFEPLKMTISDG